MEESLSHLSLSDKSHLITLPFVTGSDTTGDGSVEAPFRSVQAAMTAGRAAVDYPEWIKANPGKLPPVELFVPVSKILVNKQEITKSEDGSEVMGAVFEEVTKSALKKAVNLIEANDKKIIKSLTSAPTSPSVASTAASEADLPFLPKEDPHCCLPG